MTLSLFVSNFELSKHLSVFVPLWLSFYKEIITQLELDSELQTLSLMDF